RLAYQQDSYPLHLTQFKRDQLANKEQVAIDDQDDDTDEIYVMKMRWRGNCYNFIGKWGKIVRRKGLKAGKEIKIRWANGSLNFSVPYEPVVQTTMAVMMSHHHDEWPIRKHQIIVNTRDDDTCDVFLMKLKWRGSYYNLIGKWGQIIRRKTLEVR
ncbi:B3 DNA binding domain-containing protein, partial [Tanacetum coccineum]